MSTDRHVTAGHPSPGDPEPQEEGALRFARRAQGVLFHALTAAAVAMVLMLLAVMLREIVGRYVFNNPSGWAEEIAGYLVAGVTFLGAAYSLRSGNMISVTLLMDRLPHRVRGWFVGIGYLFSFLVLLLVLYYTSSWVLDNYLTDRRSNTGLRTRLWIPQAVMLLGLLGLEIELLRQAVRSLAGRDKGGDDHG